MGRRDAKDTIGSSSKRRKRFSNKPQKKKKTRASDSDSETSAEVSFDDETEAKAPFKLKIKMAPSPKNSINKKKKGNKGKDSGTSSEEERWLNAIESGKLEEVDDELKKIKPKDPKMMTARQRAMYEKGNDKDPNPEVLLCLPSGYKEKVMTPEAIEKAAIKSQKRKQLADEKRELDKKKTMEKLLKKQDPKISRGQNKLKPVKKEVPLISYRNTVDIITLSLPPNISFPLRSQKCIDPPKPVICGIAECNNLKKYACSQTGIPLCSLECYKKNLVNIVVS